MNSSRAIKEKDIEQTALNTNLEAAEEIALQLRLRDLAGIVAVDFIDMEEAAHRQQVQDFLGEMLAEDRVKTVIHGFTQLGLMEMTRKKTRNPYNNSENTQ